MTVFIHEQPEWPRFVWDEKQLISALLAFRHAQGRLLGKMESLFSTEVNDFLGSSIQSEPVLTQDVIERINKIIDYDLDFLTENFIEDKVMEFSPEQLFPLMKHFSKFGLKVDISIARSLEKEFKKFIIMTLIRPDKRNAPSGPVDMYWHYFVLHTPEYVQFCNDIFGEYGTQPRLGKHFFQDVAEKRAAMVDHIPATDETRPKMYKAYQDTWSLYETIYGAPDEKFWPKPTFEKQVTCGDSYSGFVAPFLNKTIASATL